MLYNLPQIRAEIVTCRGRSRLVEWREQVARTKRAAYRQQVYWGRPVPGFGDAAARILVCGLAPGAHGANRTGRVFTGDRSGDFLYAALHRAGLANQPTSCHRDDGLTLHQCYITCCVRCCPPGNRPTPQEQAACEPFLVAELRALTEVRCIVCLGALAWDGIRKALRALTTVPRNLPRFAHGVETVIEPFTLLGCYHPSQQNTFTGRLTPSMLDAVLARACQVAALS